MKAQRQENQIQVFPFAGSEDVAIRVVRDPSSGEVFITHDTLKLRGDQMDDYVAGMKAAFVFATEFAGEQ